MFAIDVQTAVKLCARSHWSTESPTNTSEEKKYVKGCENTGMPRLVSQAGIPADLGLREAVRTGDESSGNQKGRSGSRGMWVGGMTKSALPTGPDPHLWSKKKTRPVLSQVCHVSATRF